MKLYIVRHGQTDWNLKHKVQGKADISLNDRGLQQAEQTRENIQHEPIDLIICSPLRRAKETATVINKHINVPIIYDEQISERDFGEFEGRKQEDFDFEGFWSYKQNQHYERAENIRDFFNRIYRRLDEIKKQYQDKRVLLVTHGGVSIAVDCYFNGIPDKENLLSLVLENCKIRSYCIKREYEYEDDRE